MVRERQVSRDQVLSAIQESFQTHGYAPTIEELRKSVGVGSTRTVLRYLRELEDEGAIERWRGARGIRLLRSPDGGLDTVRVPLVGEAPAGPFMLAEQNVEFWVRMHRAALHPPSAKFFLLRVRGDSMNLAHVANERIESGDLVLVRAEAVAESGEIVVVLVDGEATIKRLRRSQNHWVLEPRSTNAAHNPIVLFGDFRIQGIVQKVLKRGADVLLDAR